MADGIHVDDFVSEGRGPELQRVCWTTTGATILAVTYFNPNDVHELVRLKHVRFRRPQVVRIVPQEVLGSADSETRDPRQPRAAMFDLGQSQWLRSFNPHHLGACSHFRLVFYDQTIDVIAEGLECLSGDFAIPG